MQAGDDEPIPPEGQDSATIDLSEYAESRQIEEAKREPEAFAWLYRAHYPAIQRYLRRRLGSPEVVEDAVSDTFVAALQNLHRYEDRGLPFRAWLYRLANSSANRHRRRAAALAMVQLESEPADVAELEDPGIELSRIALLLLASRYQAVLSLHYLEGLSIDEVAVALDCRPGTVKSRLSRGRDALRSQLQRMGWPS